ncbi:hypothetical protein NQ314_002678 [Rhamnusium bicolor]|uniref:Uncharacterized protein n=1 Tax=Rhamnusium bicolor TaxID=1586634 RepID=A0AAV8ZRN4_9CUCU|nr:hypothetical protein NQ314_002678 [Rhamnusium bicolor]
MTRDMYNKLIVKVQEAELAAKKTPSQNRRLKRFRIIEVGETKKLSSRSEPIKYYLPAEEIFDIIEAATVAIGHGGRDRLKTETSRKYANMTINLININTMWRVRLNVSFASLDKMVTLTDNLI